MLDGLHPALRHFLIAVVVAPFAGFLGIVVGSLVANGGFSGFDFGSEALTALNAASVVAGSGLLGWSALYLTPLTRQYGIGSGE
jgi:hypothetical protein